MNWMKRCGLGSQDWAIVTGASAGLGREYVRQLAEAGLNLVLVARRRERLEQIKRDLSNAGVQSLIVAEDLATQGAAVRIAEAVGERPVGMIVNNAGFGLSNYFHKCDRRGVLDMIAVHSTAPAELVHGFLPDMVERNRGAIVNISSIAAFTPTERNVAYTATKMFLNGFSEALEMEMARLAPNVCVQALCPGATRTEFHHLPEYDDFDTNSIPAFLWMTSSQVVNISLSKLGKKTIVIPGFKNEVFARLLRVPAIRKTLLK